MLLIDTIAKSTEAYLPALFLQRGIFLFVACHVIERMVSSYRHQREEIDRRSLGTHFLESLGDVLEEHILEVYRPDEDTWVALLQIVMETAVATIGFGVLIGVVAMPHEYEGFPTLETLSEEGIETVSDTLYIGLAPQKGYADCGGDVRVESVELRDVAVTDERVF